MSRPRTPASFPIAAGDLPPAPSVPREPKAIADATVRFAPADQDAFDLPDPDLEPPLPAVRRARSRLGAVFLGALGLLISLAVGLWTDSLIRELFARAEWLGWLAAAIAAAAFGALVVILAREALALRRLASLRQLRERGAAALAADDSRAAIAVVDDLVGLYAARPETAAARRVLADLRGEVVDGADRIRLAETELLAPFDGRARLLALDAAKRVSLVTAVSPRAVVDLLYVAFEAARLVRRIAELYGARPGFLGFVRIVRDVLAHLAVTGSIAVGDSFVQQIVGHGLAARLSARLGEGLVNGMMTARIGIAAIDAARPLPFAAVKRPSLRDFLAALGRFSAARDNAS